MNARHISHKNRCHCKIKCCSIEIEAIAGGDHKCDDLTGYAEFFHIFHRPWKRRLAAGRRKGNSSGLGDCLNEFFRGSSKENNGQKYKQEEDKEGNIKVASNWNRFTSTFSPMWPTL